MKCYRRKIQYYETDRMNVVHHSNYIRWFEEARVDFFENAGIPYDDIEKHGLMTPVLSAECSYITAMQFGQTFRIELNMSFFNGVKFEFEYKVYNDDTDELCAKGKTSHCFVNSDFKATRITHSYPEIYNAMLECTDTGERS